MADKFKQTISNKHFFQINCEKSAQLNLERSVESVETSSKY
jgi:hypothetical protein